MTRRSAVFVEADVHYMPKDKAPVKIPSAISIKLAEDGRMKSMFVGMDRSLSHPLRDVSEKFYAD